MAQQKRVELIDDLDGSTADETVSFGLDNTSYEIDLSETNATELRTHITEFIEHARPSNQHKTATQSPRKKTAPQTVTARQDRERTQAIRTWARAAGYELSHRGRIPTTVMEAYDRAH